MKANRLILFTFLVISNICFSQTDSIYICAYGYVFDKETNDCIAFTEIRIIDSERGIRTVVSDSTSYFEYNLKPNLSYTLLATKTNYFNAKFHLSTLNVQADSSMKINFFLERIKTTCCNKPEFQFERNDYLHPQYLNCDSLAPINTFVKYLTENPNIIITLNGHLAPGEKARIEIKRAKFVRKQLIANNINKKRVFVTKYKNNKHNIDFPKSSVTIQVIGTDFEE